MQNFGCIAWVSYSLELKLPKENAPHYGCRTNRNVEQRRLLPTAWEQPKSTTELHIFPKTEGVVAKTYFFFEIVLFADDEPEYRKSGIPQPIHKVLMAKFAGADSGSASGASGMDESSASDDDTLQTSGSGEAASGSQKKTKVNAIASGSGEAAAAPATASPTVGAAEIGSGSGSLAEG